MLSLLLSQLVGHGFDRRDSMAYLMGKASGGTLFFGTLYYFLVARRVGAQATIIGFVALFLASCAGLVSALGRLSN